MNIVSEFTSHSVIIILGLLLIKWYERKKGWEYKFKTSLAFILCWKTPMLIILIGINSLIDSLSIDLLYGLYFFYPILLVVVSFFVNILLGVKFFKIIYKQKTQESIVIILIIVIIEMILESILFYSILIPESIISNYNL
ncbi:MAG: hypothetical protein ACXACO_20635 [Promethearchaeota archaeon]|jgi:hypothetical protein